MVCRARPRTDGFYSSLTDKKPVSFSSANCISKGTPATVCSEQLRGAKRSNRNRIVLVACESSRDRAKPREELRLDARN